MTTPPDHHVCVIPKPNRQRLAVKGHQHEFRWPPHKPSQDEATGVRCHDETTGTRGEAAAVADEQDPLDMIDGKNRSLPLVRAACASRCLRS